MIGWVSRLMALTRLITTSRPVLGVSGLGTFFSDDLDVSSLSVIHSLNDSLNDRSTSY